MNFPKKVKKVIQVVDATASIEESDQHHAGRTTIKRKEMVQLQTQQERDEYAAERSEKQDAKKMKKYGNTELGDLSQVEMVSLRGEIDDLAKDKMTKDQRKQLAQEKMLKIGAVLRNERHARKNTQRATSNKLGRELKYYNAQKEIGMAVGLANPMQAHKAKMDEKYGEKKSRNLKLHSVGKMGKDGTLTIGQHAMKRTDNKLREQRSGGVSTNAMFKRMKK